MTTTPSINAQTLETLRGIPTQTLIDGLWVMGWPMSFVHGAKPLQPGQHMAGRAVTLRFVPHRPDLVLSQPRNSSWRNGTLDTGKLMMGKRQFKVPSIPGMTEY